MSVKRNRLLEEKNVTSVHEVPGHEKREEHEKSNALQND
jgi:hypothetical protein